MGFQTRFESLSVHNRCLFARQAVLESGSGVRKARSHILRRRAGSSYLLLADERSRSRLGMFAIGERVSIM